jgi:SsrA-binding protein
MATPSDAPSLRPIASNRRARHEYEIQDELECGIVLTGTEVNFRRGEHPPARERKLLAHKKELSAWEKRVKERGVTIVPLSLYFKNSRVKVKLGLGRGKKQFDKRETQRERTDQREIARAMAQRRRG